jgi:hypothetical protein
VLPLPGVQQLLHVPPLRVAELESRQEPSCLGDVVVLDGRLEVLAHRDRLAQLPPQPAEEAHLRGVHGQISLTCRHTARANGAMSTAHNKSPAKMQIASTLSRPCRSQ